MSEVLAQLEKKGGGDVDYFTPVGKMLVPFVPADGVPVSFPYYTGNALASYGIFNCKGLNGTLKIQSSSSRNASIFGIKGDTNNVIAPYPTNGTVNNVVVDDYDYIIYFLVNMSAYTTTVTFTPS